MSLYNPNIPQPGNRPSDSQGQILNNFQTLDTSFAVDHVNFSLGTNAGNHKQITFDTNHPAAAPIATTQSILYTKNVGGVPGLFWRNSVAALEQPISPNAGGVFAWAVWDAAGALGAHPILAGYNITLTKTGTGTFTIGYLSPPTTALFAIFAFGFTLTFARLARINTLAPVLSITFTKEESPFVPEDVNRAQIMILGT